MPCLYTFLAGNGIDDIDSKCAPPKRLYPALSDLESNESYSDNETNCCTTATVSARSTADEMRNATTQPLRGHQHTNAEQGEDNEDRCADRFYSCLLFLLCLD